MKIRRLTTALAAVAALTFALPQLADAQGAPPPPPGPGGGGPGAGGPPPGPGGPGAPVIGKRLGWTWGVDMAIGAMKSKTSGSFGCAGCDYQPAAFGFGIHGGLQLTPQLAILADFRTTGQMVAQDVFDDIFLFQSTFMVAAKYHVAPRLWVQGGLGGANLSLSANDGFTQADEDVANGGAVMAAGGYEIANNRRMSIDLSLRVVNASYDGLGDSIQSVMFGLEFNFHPRPRIRVMARY